MNSLWKILSYFCNIIPTTNIIAFNSFPDYSDNTYAFCKMLSERSIDKKYNFVWLLLEKNNIPIVKELLKKDGIKSKVYYRLSIMGFWTFVRARYVFITHGFFDKIILKQHPDKIINLWHGMPLKLLGASEKRGEACSYNSNYTIASSVLYQKIMAEAFAINESNVLVTGQPRCDLLFKESDWFESVGIEKDRFKRIGMWMPTYRKSIIGDIRIDGNYIEGGISILREVDLDILDKDLRDANILLLIKIHPMDVLNLKSFNNYTNISIIKASSFKSQLYPLLGTCDFLLTDYSSVFIDYLILKKPIAFVMNDIDTYKKNRGFYFENIEEVLPGPILRTYEDLIEFIKTPTFYCSNDIFNIYNKYHDNMASERIINQLKL